VPVNLGFAGAQPSQRREQQGGEEREGAFHWFVSFRFHFSVSSNAWNFAV
jgi:hypothetical protein